MHLFLAYTFFWERLLDSYQIPQERQDPKGLRNTGSQRHLNPEDPGTFVFISSFRCSECQEPLTNWCYEKDGKLYCHKDYWGKFGEFCHGCSLLMTGPVMVSGVPRLCPSGSSESIESVSRSLWPCIFWSSHPRRPCPFI